MTDEFKKDMESAYAAVKIAYEEWINVGAEHNIANELSEVELWARLSASLAKRNLLIDGVAGYALTQALLQRRKQLNSEQKDTQ